MLCYALDIYSFQSTEFSLFVKPQKLPSVHASSHLPCLWHVVLFVHLCVNLLTTHHDKTLYLSFLEQESLQFDEVDFDEPMEVGNENNTAVKAEAELEIKPTVKVEPKDEPQDAMLM